MLCSTLQNTPKQVLVDFDGTSRVGLLWIQDLYDTLQAALSFCCELRHRYVRCKNSQNGILLQKEM